MINKKFREAVKIVNEKLNMNRIKWALVGSANMQLQGMAVTPRDLDIVVQLKDLKKIKSIFSEYDCSEIKELPPFIGEKEPAFEIRIIINEVDVQFFGEKNDGKYVSKLLAGELVKIDLDESEIPCFTLEAEAQTYAETNRKHKTDLINDFIKQN